MPNVQSVNITVSPLLAKTLNIKADNNTKTNTVEPQTTTVVGWSPLLVKSILAQNKQILPANGIVNVNTPASNRVQGYHNDLKDMLTHNKANILAVIPRIMNAQDKDGNELIQGDEVSGNFVNAVARLDEIKDLGFNCQHVLPIHPPGKIHAMGTAGSLYAPLDFLTLDPELVDENPPYEARKRIEELYEQKTGKKLLKMDKNDPEVAFAQCKYYVDECHKRGIKLMLDLPSCASVDFARMHPEMMAVGADGREKVPQGWQDIRMLRPFENEKTRELNKSVLDLHKKYVDMAIDLGFDGIRADVGRAKPVEFWNVIINYSHAKDPQFAWLAETYTHEDASPQLNMPYDRPQELLEVGFDSYYGQYHIYNDWTTAQQLYDYVKENIDMNNEIKSPKSLIGSFATHDDVSPMLYGGAPWVMYTTVLQTMLPQVNPYMTDGVQTGDFYIFPYDHALVRDSETDNHECTVHTGRMDIFNKSRKPGGSFPQIAEVVKSAFSLRNNNYNEVNKDTPYKLQMTNPQDVLTKGSFIILPTNNPEIVAFARHKDGKTLLFIGNRNVNKAVGGTIEIPGLKDSQKFHNLIPAYGEECKFQNNQNGSINVELGKSRACVFEIDDANIERLSNSQNVLQQHYLN
ncbi:MAG: hypothetical protein IJ877_01810 [Candidatus Gastranaerophilales bacterium]|nr:hypothetical protein [Candidatus Gastranaerophilales bacterium]